MTAALELSRNQVTHFYSERKNTQEMITMMDLLRVQYRDCQTIYLSWDAASWHMSKRLFARMKDRNEEALPQGYPIVKAAPLPACAQFLNVIESVFSGLARAVIHNSDYPSVDQAKAAIDRHFQDRNEHFKTHPKRALQRSAIPLNDDLSNPDGKAPTRRARIDHISFGSRPGMPMA